MKALGRFLFFFVTPALLAGCSDAWTDEGPAMFRGDPAHTGVYAAGGAPVFGGLLWRFSTEGPVRSDPAVAGGRVYFGSADGSVYALDPNGRPLWKTDTGAAVRSSPAVSGGRVIVQSRRGEVLALSAERGEVQWRFQGGADVPFDWGFESGDLYVSSPVVVEGRVLVGSGDGNLYALDEATGKERWRLKTGGRVRSSPAVAGGRVFAGSMDGSVYAADLETGRLAWRFDTEGRALRSADFGFDRKSVQSSPAVADGRVYVGARDGSIYAIDARTGERVWRVDHQGSWVITSPAVRDGRVYLGSSDGHFIQAVEAATGKEVWRAATGNAAVWSSPALAGGTLYIGDNAGTLRALDARTGAVRWEYRLGAGIYGTPVPVDGAVLVGSNDGALYAIRSGEGGALRRAVFWDEQYRKSAWLTGHEDLRDALVARGFEALDAKGLAAFLEGALEDGSASRSVVVFAIDHLPADLAGLLRRYLAAGGKVVWVGVPPLIWPRDPVTGSQGAYNRIDRRPAKEMLGVDFSAANFDRWGARVTAAGRAWGLSGWWLAPWSVQPDQVSEVLAEDENGLAASWVKSFGGPPGTGFVMIGRGLDAPVDPGFAAAVAAAADYRPR